jgi:hypothetical protein
MIYVITQEADDFLRFQGRNAVDSSSSREVAGVGAALAAVRAAVDSEDGRWACFVSADVFLPGNYAEGLVKIIAELDREWPNWGCAAACARTPFHSGYLGQNVVRYSGSPGAFPNRMSTALPAMMLEGEIFLLNLSALREAGVTIPRLDGAIGLDTVLSVATLAAGRGLMVVPGLAAWRPHSKVEAGADVDAAVIDYLAGQIANRTIETSRGVLELGSADRQLYPAKGRNLPIDSLRYACLGRPQRKVAIVTRTRFTRIALLQRVIRSVQSFVAAAGKETHFEHHIISDQRAPSSFKALKNMHFVEVEQGRDSRFLLVAHAVKAIDADFFWFVDDDDWLFPNAAERLALLLMSVPVDALIVVDCQQFDEHPFPGTSEDDVAQYVSSPKQHMPAERFFGALSGQNFTPFCGAIFPRTALLALPDELVGQVTYLEDYTILLSTLLGKYQVFQCRVLMAGISIRKSGNTITEVDRTKWDQNMARVISYLVNDVPTNDLISLSDVSRNVSAVPAYSASYAEEYHAMLNSTSWKLTRPLRVFARIVRGKLSFREFLVQVRRALRG